MYSSLHSHWKDVRKQGIAKFIIKMVIFWTFGWGLLFTLFVYLVEPEIISKKYFLHLLCISFIGGIALGSYIWFRFERNFRKVQKATILLPKPDDIHWHTGGVQFVYNLKHSISFGIECLGVPIDGKIPYMTFPDRELAGLLINDENSNLFPVQAHVEKQHILEEYSVSWVTYGGTRFFVFKAGEFIPIYKTILDYIANHYTEAF